MNKKLLSAFSLAAAGGGLMVGCTQPTPPAPDPVPALDCYTGDANFDAKVVGLVGEADGIEAYDPGSDCSTNDSVGAASLAFVGAADATEALNACFDLDGASTFVVDMSGATTPAPGLAGYWVCSGK